MENRPKVLYIENEKDMRDLVGLILEPRGFDLIDAEGGQEGLDRIRAEKPDLILLDLMMPGVDGWEVYRQLRADDELAGIPVIVITVRTRSLDEAMGLRIPEARDYITKPFSQAELVDSINRVLGRD